MKSFIECSRQSEAEEKIREIRKASFSERFSVE